jgi:hypothetical protein
MPLGCKHFKAAAALAQRMAAASPMPSHKAKPKAA